MTTLSDACGIFTQRLTQDFPRRAQIESVLVAGLTRRIVPRIHKDVNQQVAATWGDFFDAQIYRTIVNRTPSQFLYAVYSAGGPAYISSNHFTVGAEVSDGPFAIRIEAGDYLIFSGPAGKQENSANIWHVAESYFIRNPHIRRKLGSDFERYTGPDKVELFIGIA
jgi:hypothetical protein